jgi:hypothetical protein
MDAQHPKSLTSAKMIQELKEHFLKWSGGLPPESDYQITVYIDYAAEVKDEELVREVLRAMMNEDSFEFAPPAAGVADASALPPEDWRCQPCAIVQDRNRPAPALHEAAPKLLEFARLFLAYHDNETDDDVTIETLEHAARAAIAGAEASTQGSRSA